MNRTLFTESIRAIQAQSKIDDEFAKNFKTIFEVDVDVQYDHSKVSNQLLKVLQVQMDDDNFPSLIEHYLNDLTEIKNAGELFDELIALECQHIEANP